jgi:hypothetical protein
MLISPLKNIARSAIATLSRSGRNGASGGVLEWSPSANFVMHDDNVSTDIAFAPLAVTRQADARFFWEFRLYGKSPTEPIFTYKSGELGLFSQEVLTSAEICRQTGLDRLFNYCEIMAYSPDVLPTGVSSVLVSFQHFTSKDGSLETHLPAAYIWGAARFTRTERFHYENYPAARVSPPFRPLVITVNPFVRPMNYWVQLVDSTGRKYEEGPFKLKGKGVARWDGVNVPVDTLQDPVGVVVRSETKCASFVGAVNTETGRMVDLEHMHPFFAR